MTQLIMNATVEVQILDNAPSVTPYDPLIKRTGELSIYPNYIEFHAKYITLGIKQIISISLILQAPSSNTRIMRFECVDSNNYNIVLLLTPPTIIDATFNWQTTLQKLYTTVIKWKEENDYIDARTLEDAMEYEAALKKFASLSRVSDCQRVRLKQAYLLEKNKNYESALEIYKSLNSENDIVRVLVKNAQDAVDRQEYDFAIEVYSKLKMFEERKNIYLLKAANLENNMQYDEALEIYRKIELKDEIVRVLLIKEKLLEEAFRYEDAAKILEELKRFKEAGELRKKAIIHNASITKVDIGTIDRSTHIQDSIINRSIIGNESNIYKNCPYCGKSFNLPKTPKFCPYCNEQLS